MSGLLLGCIADDYTGASDLANTLTRAGLRTIQTIGVPDAGQDLPEVDAVVVSLKSRSIPAPVAVAMARGAHGWLKAKGAGHIMFKICSTFDSTDAGNIGPVTDALREDEAGGIVLVTPAFPETARTVFMGHLFVGDVLLSESPLKDHPLNPMKDANLVRVLGRQSAHPVGLIRLSEVAQGPQAISSRLAKLTDDGVGAAIVDAVFDADLDAIAEAALDGSLSVGASGLGLGLARRLAAIRGPAPAEAQWGGAASAEGSLACLSGSCSAATLEQIAAAQSWMPVLQLDTAGLLAGEDEVARALDWASPRLADGPLLIASSAPPGQVQDLQRRFGREASGRALEQGLAAIAEGLVAMGVHRLIVAGGETSGAVVDRLDARMLSVGPEIAPGVPVLRVVGGEAQGMLLTLKSGNFGGPDFFAKAVRQMSPG